MASVAFRIRNIGISQHNPWECRGKKIYNTVLAVTSYHPVFVKNQDEMILEKMEMILENSLYFVLT